MKSHGQPHRLCKRSGSCYEKASPGDECRGYFYQMRDDGYGLVAGALGSSLGMLCMCKATAEEDPSYFCLLDVCFRGTCNDDFRLYPSASIGYLAPFSWLEEISYPPLVTFVRGSRGYAVRLSQVEEPESAQSLSLEQHYTRTTDLTDIRSCGRR